MPFNRLGELGTPLFRSGTNWVRRDSGLWVAEEPLNLKKDSYILKEGRSAYLYMGTLYYTSNGTFKKADYPGLRAVKVKAQGGGGAGGGRSGSGPSVGAGGGGGGYGEKFILADDLAPSESITVGQGGSGRGANSGLAGSASSFGNHITARGGDGGDWTATLNSTAQGGNGGTVSGADFFVPGQIGQQARIYDGNSVRIFFPGSGGSSFLGLGALSFAPGQTGSGRTGTGWGAGGSGASGSASDQPGGDGRQGIVIVELYG